MFVSLSMIHLSRGNRPLARCPNQLWGGGVQHNPDLLFSRILLAGRPADALHKTLGRRVGRSGLLSHRVSLRVTMSRKSSIPQDANSVSMALMPDTKGTKESRLMDRPRSGLSSKEGSFEIQAR